MIILRESCIKEMCDSFGLLRERRYAILGTGALGGFYGAKLQKAGLDVHFLLKSDYEHVSKSGLFVAPSRR
jgi:2-dehydropantoate 2-reductase